MFFSSNPNLPVIFLMSLTRMEVFQGIIDTFIISSFEAPGIENPHRGLLISTSHKQKNNLIFLTNMNWTIIDKGASCKKEYI